MPTSWNPADKTSNITLSGSNLIAACVAASVGQGVRTVDSLGSGKFYWEYVWTTTSSFQVTVGVAIASASLGSIAANYAGAAGVESGSGTIYINTTGGSPPSIGAVANGNVIGIAIDLGGKLIWFRKAPAGNWNASGTANPGTGAGGLSISALTLPVYGVFAAAVFNAGDTITANFGGSAFSGTVPSGFTSGFPLGGSGAGGGGAQARCMVMA